MDDLSWHLRPYTDLVLYIGFAGIVTLGLGIAGALLVIDTLVKRFVKRADYFKHGWVPVDDG